MNRNMGRRSLNMRCGEKRFFVEIELDGVKQKKTVTARTPVEARKRIRMECGSQVEILSVTRERENKF